MPSDSCAVFVSLSLRQSGEVMFNTRWAIMPASLITDLIQEGEKNGLPVIVFSSPSHLPGMNLGARPTQPGGSLHVWRTLVGSVPKAEVR